MYDSRNRSALQELSGLGRDPGPLRWHWAIVGLEPCGRLLLPDETRRALEAGPGDRAEVRGVCRRAALVLRADGGGRRMAVDGRGRLYVPAWLRRQNGEELVVGTHIATSIVVVTSPSWLDALGDELTGVSS